MLRDPVKLHDGLRPPVASSHMPDTLESGMGAAERGMLLFIVGGVTE